MQKTLASFTIALMTFELGNLRGTPAYAELTARCRTYSILIAPSSDLRSGGSGTLVRYKHLCGILTGTHVIAACPNTHLIYSPLKKTEDSTVFLNVGVPLQRIIYLETIEGMNAILQNGRWRSETLDICLLQISLDTFNDILKMSGKQAVDLSNHREKYIARRDYYIATDPISPWSWAVDGSPRESATHDDNRILHSRFDGVYVCGGSKTGTYKTDPLTLVKAPFDRDADRLQHDFGPTLDTIPDSFGGISGGGMWQVSFRGENQVPQAVDEMFFSGVCIAEVPQKCLYSRGPSSLYDIFTSHLDTLKEAPQG